MNLPLNKNKSWIALLHKSINGLDENQQAAIMKPCGQGCASDVLALCEKLLGKKVNSLEDLITGWNMIRDKRGLTGRWEFELNAVRGIFRECGCPLVKSGRPSPILDKCALSINARKREGLAMHYSPNLFKFCWARGSVLLIQPADNKFLTFFHQFGIKMTIQLAGGGWSEWASVKSRRKSAFSFHTNTSP